MNPLKGSAAINSIERSGRTISNVAPSAVVSMVLSAVFGMLLLFSLSAQAASSVALGYTPKYRPGFKHFAYVNPDAPKSGELILSGFGNFDSLNPYILRGVSVDGLGGLIFEPLMVQAEDEPYGLYAHIARDIQLAKNRLSVTFEIDPAARFSNGRRVTAKDIKFTFDTLRSEKGHPYFRFYWADLKAAVVLGKTKIRFDFARLNPELHLIAAQIPVIAPEWVGDTPFDKLSKKNPIGTGPYTIKKYRLGKDITYERRKNYWAVNKNTRRGMYNFDLITYKYFKDETVQLEALKAGEFDFVLVNHSKQWARDYVGPQFDSGKIVRKSLKHRNNAGMQGFVFNTRRELFKDARVRRAMTLAFDFDWSNKNLFYNQYTRCDSYFSNSEMASSGIPQGEELALLNRYRAKLPKKLFTQAWVPPKSPDSLALRKNLIMARDLLEEAGWQIKDGRLTNEQGRVFEFDFLLAQKGFERILAPYAHNLAKLGITMNYRTVDVSLYIKRQRTFDFDMMVSSIGQSQSPGNELFNVWHSKSATQEGTNNIAGINDPVVDALVKKVVYAPNRHKLVIATRALDRVLLWGEYLVPNWYINVHRVAYWDRFAAPDVTPLYYGAENWVISSWWKKPASQSVESKN